MAKTKKKTKRRTKKSSISKGSIVAGAAIVLGVLLLLAPSTSTASSGGAGGGGSNNSGGIPSGGNPPGGNPGSLNESFFGTNNPRGIRNNNPGNIKIGSSNWQGKIPIENNTDGVFEQFQSFPYGARATIKLLQNYIAQGRNTPKKIIQYWDLGSPTYTAFLVNQTGFSENQVLTADKPTLKKLSQAIAKFENGQDILTDARFETAYGLL